MRLTYLSIAAVIGAGMALTQHYALLNYWYWTYWWLDLVMHTAGGVVITLLGAAFLGVRARILAITLGISLLWEVYEFMIGISVTEQNFVSDTLLDLVMDSVGALLAYGMMTLWQKSRLPLRAARDESLDQTS